MNKLKVLSLLTVVYFMPSFYSTDYIYTTLNTSFTKYFTIKFTVFSEDLQGMILRAVDSDKNVLTIRITEENDKTKYIRFKYNDILKSGTLNDSCGCIDCDFIMMNITVILLDEKAIFSCNKNGSEYTVSGLNKDKRNISERFIQVPLSIWKIPNRMFLMMGNIGPFINFQNLKTNPLKKQVIGCLKSFRLNDTKVTFPETYLDNNSTNDNVKPECIRQCVVDGLCNRGTCIETLTRIYCNCSLLELNGKFCNASLKTYNPWGQNSYAINKNIKIINMKVTWNQTSISDNFCLLEMVSSISSTVLSVDKLNGGFGNNKDSITKMGINFVNIDIGADRLTYRINNISRTQPLKWSVDDRINVGFSEQSHQCTTIHGAYDFYVKPKQLHTVINKYTSTTFSSVSDNPPDIISNYTTITNNETLGKSISAGQTYGSWIQQAIIIGPLLIGLSVLYVIIQTIFFIRRKIRKPNIGIVHTDGLMETGDDEISDNHDYRDYSLVNYDGLYLTSEGTYSLYNQSTSYSVGEKGPQLPPRDEEEPNDTRESIVSNAEYNPYNAIDYTKVYMRVQDDEYAYIRSKLESIEEDSPQLPPRDDEESSLL